jgi:hypothetical protein
VRQLVVILATMSLAYALGAAAIAHWQPILLAAVLGGAAFAGLGALARRV